MFSSLSPYFFTLLSYTSSDSNLILYVYTSLLCMTSLHMLRDPDLLFIWFICWSIYEASSLNHTTHNPVFFLSFFIACFFLSLSLCTSARYVQKHLCTTLWIVLYSGIKIEKCNFLYEKILCFLLPCIRQTFVCVSSSFYVFHAFLLNYFLMSYYPLWSLISTLYVILLNPKFFFILASTGHIILSLPAWPPAILCCI